MLRNKKGFVLGGTEFPIAVALIWGAMAFIIAKGTVETAQSGVLQRNGKTIACKMANKGEDYCNNLYGYKDPEPLYVAPAPTGRTLTSFLRKTLN